MIKFPQQTENFVWRNYLIHLYRNCWGKFSEIPADALSYMKSGILKSKLLKMENELRDVFSQEDVPSADKRESLSEDLGKTLSFYKMEQSDEFDKWTIKDTPYVNIEISKWWITSKIMDYAKRELQELGVQVVKEESGNLVFVHKETMVVVYKTGGKEKKLAGVKLEEGQMKETIEVKMYWDIREILEQARYRFISLKSNEDIVLQFIKRAEAILEELEKIERVEYL